MTQSTIHIIITGGTIDAVWDGKKDTAVIGEGLATASSLPDYFSRLILYADVQFTEVYMKDSRSLTSTDIEHIVKEVEDSSSTRILITHGTYTMPDTAKYLKAHLKRHDQTIILTGSMVPLRGFSGEYSDAAFNLGYAIAKVEDLGPGIYLAMNGRVFTPDEVVKNLAEGKFYSVFDRHA
ncbi:asparaginase [Candidatus Uhrbacteria bacterium]|nr:asparaginase [Candidatus Uhrbacteria bacterium]